MELEKIMARATTMTWHPGQQNCGVCSYPATREVNKGNGQITYTCDNHIRTGCAQGYSDIGDGSHTYMSHPNAYHALLDPGYH